MRALLSLYILLFSIAVSGCFELAGYDDFTFTKPFSAQLTITQIDKVDLLFVVDESSRTGHNQQVLSTTLELFFERLLNPLCVDEQGGPIASGQPATPLEDCPTGSKREFLPVLDIHIGVITTSLGAHGADACSDPGENKRAHLVDGGVVTYDGQGFLAWDPLGQKDPPGQSDATALTSDLVTIISTLGESGCGYESQLESWYRFLIDPDPHDDVVVTDSMAEAVGTDQVLLDQRSAFLRDDSLVAIVMLTDENDCSIRAGGQSYFAAQIYQPGSMTTPYHLPKPRAVCATNPDDPCCRSCAQSPGPGCDDSNDDCNGSLTATEDHINLRCWDQKRRFGIDFLHPIDRYITGLTSREVSDREGNVVANPLLASRDPGLVLFTGIVGVPWQDIARRDANGAPDLVAGLDSQSQPRGGFMNSTELADNGVWALILGDPPARVAPTDPLMTEQVMPRAGTHPITGEPVAAPGTAHDANSINGHEYSIPNNDDLQYACVYDLETTIDCVGESVCACNNPMNDNPLCQDPSTDAFGTVQYRAQAYPGVRHLQVLEGIGAQGVVSSVCWKQISDTTSADYGYNPAIFGAIIDKLKPSLGGQFCLDREIVPSPDGTVPCLLTEARQVEGTCDCNAPARRKLSDEQQRAVRDLAESDPAFVKTPWNCYCEVTQASGVDLAACRSQVDEPVVNEFNYGVDAWCYIDVGESIGSANLAAGCPDKRLLRLVGASQRAPQASLFLQCK